MASYIDKYKSMSDKYKPAPTSVPTQPAPQVSTMPAPSSKISAPLARETLSGTTKNPYQYQNSFLPTTQVQADIQTEGGYPKMPAFETMYDAAGNFRYKMQAPSFDVVSPWQKMALGQVGEGYQKALGANVAGEKTGYKQASEGLAMSGGLSPTQMARLAQRSQENKTMQDQLAEQQRQANELKVRLAGEDMKTGQERWIAQEKLGADIANQQTEINSIGELNDYVQKLVDDLVRKQQGKDIGGAYGG